MEVSRAFSLGSRSPPCNSEASSRSSRGCIFFLDRRAKVRSLMRGTGVDVGTGVAC